jgi:Ca2+-binding EF-hand superfamily protein
MNCTFLGCASPDHLGTSLTNPIGDHPVNRQAMIDEFDLDQDGEINEQEFFAIMSNEA